MPGTYAVRAQWIARRLANSQGPGGLAAGLPAAAAAAASIPTVTSTPALPCCMLDDAVDVRMAMRYCLAPM